MNIAERFVFPIYAWDRRRGFSSKGAVIHCRFIFSFFLICLFLDVFGLCEWMTQKGIFFSGRFLFDKIIDWIILWIIFFGISTLVTSEENWENTFKDDESYQGNIIGIYLILLFSFFFYLIIEHSFHK